MSDELLSGDGPVPQPQEDGSDGAETSDSVGTPDDVEEPDESAEKEHARRWADAETKQSFWSKLVDLILPGI